MGSFTPVTGSWEGMLQAADGANGNDPSTEWLSQAQLDGIVSAARSRLADAGIDAAALARLADVRFTVGDLAGADLGSARIASNQVVIDGNAAGYGWFVDSSPLDDTEFVNGVAPAGTPAARGMDLLTTVLHELGHFAGLADLPDSGGSDVMIGFLSTGKRRDALDDFFTAHSVWDE